ncbi:UvrD-helicase domain-containing protein [Escherichia coli]
MAVPGSGQTRFLPNNIAHLISDCSFTARKTGAVTHTTKCARVCKRR